MSKLYIICSVNYEYNDEGYDKEGIDRLESAYTSLKKAEEVCLKKNLEEARGWEEDSLFRLDGNYRYDFYDYDDDPEQFIAAVLGMEHMSVASLTDEQLAELLIKTGIEFYVIREVEVSD